MELEDFRSFVRMSPQIILQGAKVHVKSHSTHDQTPPKEDDLNPNKDIDVSTLTFEQAQEAVTERNRRRAVYGNAQISINLALDNRDLARANTDQNEILNIEMPCRFWARLLSYLEAESGETESYLRRRDAVLMCEAIRQKLRDHGF